MPHRTRPRNPARWRREGARGCRRGARDSIKRRLHRRRLLMARGFLTAKEVAAPRWYDLLWFGFRDVPDVECRGWADGKGSGGSGGDRGDGLTAAVGAGRT